jgi:hypothetical protein
VREYTLQKNAEKMGGDFALAVTTQNFINCLLEGVVVRVANIPSRTFPVDGSITVG